MQCKEDRALLFLESLGQNGKATRDMFAREGITWYRTRRVIALKLVALAGVSHPNPNPAGTPNPNPEQHYAVRPEQPPITPHARACEHVRITC